MVFFPALTVVKNYCISRVYYAKIFGSNASSEISIFVSDFAVRFAAFRRCRKIELPSKHVAVAPVDVATSKNIRLNSGIIDVLRGYDVNTVNSKRIFTTFICRWTRSYRDPKLRTDSLSVYFRPSLLVVMQFVYCGKSSRFLFVH